MSELKKTGVFAGVAVVLLILAFAFSPRRITPEAFMDQGELFFPEFKDPNAAQTLEVIEYDEKSGTARPFKVTFQNGRWTIPSHHDYPADAQDRLAKAAAGVIVLRKDDFRTNSVADHEACGVVDPLDMSSPGLKGRGTKFTLKGAGDQVLADLIIGKPVPEREGMRFVRKADENRVYAAKVDLDVSTRFEDWIETNLLKVDKNKIERVVFDNYSIDERSGSLVAGEKVELRKENDEWKISPRPKGREELDISKVNQLLRSIEELKIVGVRPKPAGLSASLAQGSGSGQMSQEDRISLQSKGFYISRRDGQLLSNEGDIKVYTSDGVVYTMRFGEVLYGTGLEVTAGLSDEEGQKSAEAQTTNRYLFVTSIFDGSQLKEPPRPASTDFRTKPDSLWTDFDKECKETGDKYEEYQRRILSGRSLSNSLNERFAGWYYVISDDSFRKVHVDRKELLRDKDA